MIMLHTCYLLLILTNPNIKDIKAITQLITYLMINTFAYILYVITACNGTCNTCTLFVERYTSYDYITSTCKMLL